MIKKDVIKIRIDHREVNEVLKQTWLNEPSVTVEMSQLKTGDFVINDLLLIERKTIMTWSSPLRMAGFLNRLPGYLLPA